MDVDTPLRALFRYLSIAVLVLLGAALFLFPEPFTSLLGLVLVAVAFTRLRWARSRKAAAERGDGSA
ncbi:hypothetical protein [Halosimplex pelagicum]|uniref:Uncharacterized protein n=1 Tax=Halosimplex pelagicum TaxID=869886 RepID=A0A7D5P9E1_9EURY|nr:hypothetical protein [Halosimplex pelagicum]QLH82561.1 hypothetical protein HZS54_13455 [Halosimplex pelagicum]